MNLKLFDRCDRNFGIPSFLIKNMTATSDSAIKGLLSQLYTCETSQECLKMAEDLAGALRLQGSTALKTFGILENLSAAVQNKKSGLERESGLLGLWGLARGMGRMAEPYLLPLFPLVLESYADKGQPVREAAQLTAIAFLEVFSPHATKMLLPILFEAMAKKWQTKVAALEHLESLVARAPVQIAFQLPLIIQHVEECMHDTKPDVRLFLASVS